MVITGGKAIGTIGFKRETKRHAGDCSVFETFTTEFKESEKSLGQERGDYAPIKSWDVVTA